MTREQFIASVRAEQEGLRKFLLALCCGDRQRADDIAQDALVKAFLACDGYVPRAGFSAWLYKIAYNSFIDGHRKRCVPTVDADSAPVSGTASDLCSDGAFRYQDLYDAIEELPPGERAAILLFYMEDRPVKEISAILNIPQGTVRSQLTRGREHLRNKIKR